MAILTITEGEVVEIKGLVDERASDVALPVALFRRETTLGAATDWAYMKTKQGRTDAVGAAEDFEMFLEALTAEEMTYFRRAVFYRTAAIVVSRYRELMQEDSGSFVEEFANAKEGVPFLFEQANDQLVMLRAVSGTTKAQRTYFVVT